MKVLYPGHLYMLDQLDTGPETQLQLLQFVQRRPLHPARSGTTNQEVCRALIDRVQILNAEKPWSGNADILHHLREVIFLHEVRAHQRHREKSRTAARFSVAEWKYRHYYNVNLENIPVGNDGHWEVK